MSSLIFDADRVMYNSIDEIVGDGPIGPIPEPEITIDECVGEYDPSYLDYEYTFMDRDCCLCEDCAYNLNEDHKQIDVIQHVLRCQIEVASKEHAELRAKYETLLQQAPFPKFTIRPARVPEEFADVDAKVNTRNERRNCSCAFCQSEEWHIVGVKLKNALRAELCHMRAEHRALLHEYGVLREFVASHSRDSILDPRVTCNARNADDDLEG
ncbi:hypothetical protein EYC84_005132 [Monilinia fructicola]|uniref:Uncharacterized protein n=1 Tax=Monilinia fructicola TaxID=38448 RepID=A0A5M9JVK6_MONFR|nr:hypothetical protein EYC84_005132 [Monilinia fructicola]